jgi:2'-5' RNA ligase
VAVLLPETLRGRIDRAAAELRRHGGAVSWVRTENLHVTLRFLGSVDEATLGRVREAMAEAAAGVAPFSLAVGGFGGFPSARAPRVVWVGLAGETESLVRLHAELEAALERRGISREGRAFHPHVTLGRARDPRGAAGLAGVLGATAVGDEALGAPGDARLGETRVDAVHLMRSDLHPDGARYSVLAREGLAGRAEEPPRVDLVGGGS